VDRPLPLKRLRRILRSFDVEEDESRGKGSHTLFYKTFPDGTYTYPVPTHKDPVLVCYVKGCWRRFRLTPEHGVSDKDFYNAG
jgi:hypothetical protein